METNAFETIRRIVLNRIENERLDPETDYDAVVEAVSDAVQWYQQNAHLQGLSELRSPQHMGDRLLLSITSYGALSDLLHRDDIEEIFIEGERVIHLDSTGRLRGLTKPTSERENRHVIDRLLSMTERHLDVQNPIVQARVFGGAARLTASIPPVSDVLSATIRKYTVRRENLLFLMQAGSLPEEAAGFLWAVAQTTSSFLFSGPPGSGKTTALRSVLAAVPAHRCIRACEEIRELAVPVTLGAFYEARPPALDGSSEITLRDLVKFVLGMRPDLIVVGEVRGAEAFELTRAVNAGCGFACTIHANSALEALDALVNAAIMAGENVSENIVRRVFQSSVDYVIHLDRDEVYDIERGMRRQVLEIVNVKSSAVGDRFEVDPIFVRSTVGAPMEWSGVLPAQVEQIDRALPHGMTVRGILEGRDKPL